MTQRTATIAVLAIVAALLVLAALFALVPSSGPLV